MAANFRNRISMPTNEKSNQGVRVPPLLSPRGGTRYLKIDLLFWGVSIVFFFFFFLGSDGPIKLAHCPPKTNNNNKIVFKKNLGGTSSND